MKNIAAIGLILSIAFNFGGQYALFYFAALQHKSEVFKEIDSKENKKHTEILIIGKENAKFIRWIHDREFVYKGDYYDVISKEKKDGKFIIECYRDVKEKKLVEAATDKDDNKKNASLKNLKILKLDCLFNSYDKIVRSFKIEPFILTSSDLKFIESEKLTPPPKRFCIHKEFS